LNLSYSLFYSDFMNRRPRDERIIRKIVSKYMNKFIPVDGVDRMYYYCDERKIIVYHHLVGEDGWAKVLVVIPLISLPRLMIELIVMRDRLRALEAPRGTMPN